MKDQKGQNDFSRRAKLVWSFLKGGRLMLLLCMLCAVLIALADMVTPQIVRVAVDQVILGEPEDTLNGLTRACLNRMGGSGYLRSHLWILAGAILAVALVKAVSQYGFRVCNSRGGETMVKNMRDRLYGHIERLPFQWHMKNHTGDIIQRCTSDIDTVRNFVSEQLTSLMRIAIMLVLSIVFMMSMNVPLALIALVPMPFIILYSFRFHNSARREFRKCDENEGVLSAMAQENLTGVRVVRAFGREKYEKDRFEKHNEYYTGLWKRMACLMARFWTVSDLLSGLQMLLVIVFGVIFCLKGSPEAGTAMTRGEYIAFISYNSLLAWPIRMLGRMISEMSKAGVAVDRIGYILEAEPEKDEESALTPDLNGDIVFDHVSFAYEGAPEMLHDISLTIPAGSTLGILGGTGSGKSTMMYLLDRLYAPTSGKITIGGTDIQEIRLSHLRRGIGMVLQEPFLFSRSLRENLMITEESFSEEVMREAARAAALDETIESFTKGYDTFVGERGVTLSGGQKQRAAIARVLTRGTPIMVFDDSLSAVDTETDAKIRKALEKRFGSATIILISHRITTLSKADQVLVLDHGKVGQLGTPEELRSVPGLYRQINTIQSLSAEEVRQ